MDPRAAELQARGLQLYRDAREAGQYEVAYHALCAALHAAEALDDGGACELVEREARTCRDWIDTHAPESKLSSRSAQSRGHESIFRQLAVMAEAARLRLQADAQKRKGRL